MPRSVVHGGGRGVWAERGEGLRSGDTIGIEGVFLLVLVVNPFICGEEVPSLRHAMAVVNDGGVD